jgi:GTP cyclohydrolase II
MREFVGSGAPDSFGATPQIAVARGLVDFRAGRPVRIAASDGEILALAVDGLDEVRLAAFRNLCAPSAVRLVVTAQRAHALGIDTNDPMTLQVDANLNATRILALACDATATYAGAFGKAEAAAQAASRLAKVSQGLPAVLIANISQPRRSFEDFITIERDAIDSFGQDLLRSLTIASKASVPLSSGSRAEFVVFRDALGGNATAIIIGKPDFSKPVLVRLHSACLTGDVFGSRRCDCGDQLELAIRRLEDAGAGIILYLPQEGRGVGLANKMRAYQMQDEGLDTVDANTNLGFEDDERDYGIAGRMLQMLGCRSVVLLTNNPAKLDGLAQAGIEIADRMAIETPVNAHNVRYMTAKAERAGHRLDLLTSLGQPLDTLADDVPIAQ